MVENKPPIGIPLEVYWRTQTHYHDKILIHKGVILEVLWCKFFEVLVTYLWGLKGKEVVCRSTQGYFIQTDFYMCLDSFPKPTSLWYSSYHFSFAASHADDDAPIKTRTYQTSVPRNRAIFCPMWYTAWTQGLIGSCSSFNKLKTDAQCWSYRILLMSLLTSFLSSVRLPSCGLSYYWIPRPTDPVTQNMSW